MPTLDANSAAALRSTAPSGTVFVSRVLVDVSGTPLRGSVTVSPDLPARARVLSPLGTYLDPLPLELALDAFGAFSITLFDSLRCEPPGVLYVVAARGIRYRFLANDEDQDNRPAPQPVATAQIGGTVVDPSNRPVVGLTVACTPLVPPQDEPSHMLDWSLMLPLPLHTTTAADGSFTFTVFTQASYCDYPPLLRISAAYGIAYEQPSPL